MPYRIAALAMILITASDLQAQVPDLSGRWSGRWESQTTGHSGPLHARFTQTDPCHYRVAFRGRFFKVLPFRYTQTLQVTGYQGDAVVLSGSRRLIGFGTFEYTAIASDRDFSAAYRSRNDRGVFILGR